MISEALLTIILLATGFIFVSGLGRLENVQKLFLSFPLSALITAVCLLPKFLLGLEVGVGDIAIIEIAKLAAAVILFKKYSCWVWGCSKSFIYLVVAVVVSVVLIANVTPWITNDSALFALYGRSIELGTSQEYPSVGVPSYGYMLAALIAVYHTMSGVDFPITAVFMFWFSLIILLWYFLWVAVLDKDFNLLAKFSLVLVFLCTVPMFSLVAVYIHSNLISSYFLFLAFAMFILCKDMPDNLLKPFNFLISLAIVGLVLARVENGVLVVCLIMYMVFYTRIDKSKFNLPIMSGLLFAMLFYLYMIYITIQYSDIIIKPWSAILMLVISSGTLLLINLDGFSNRIKQYMGYKMLGALLVIAVSIQFLVDYHDSVTSFRNILDNLFFRGKWSVYWVWIAFSFVYIMYRRARGLLDNGVVLHCSIFSVLLAFLIFGMGLFRPPYRIGYGDSANRLMISVFPFASVMLVYMLYKIVKPAKNTHA